MADTYTTNLKARKPEQGAYSNAWATRINDDQAELLDDAIAGTTSINLGVSTTYSLAALGDGTDTESRAAILKFTGTPASAVTVTVPASVASKIYLVENLCGQSITIKYAASTGAIVGNGSRTFIHTDGSEVYPVAIVSANSIGLAIYPQTAEETSAGVTPTDFSYPAGHVKRYGAAIDGSTDDSVAFQNCHDSLPAVGGRFVVPSGTALVKGLDWTASDCFIQCDGTLKHANTSAGYLLKIGSSSDTVFRLRGYLNFDSGTNESGFSNIVSALRLAAIVESDLTVTTTGFVYGIDVPTEGPVAYNEFRMNNMLDNRRAVYIHPGATGYCNRNNFHGGRFALNSGVTFNSQWSIYIADSGANTPNDNQFWSPSFEGKAGVFYNEGFSNHVWGCRMELLTTGTAGTDFSDPYINQRGSGYSEFKSSYVTQMNAMTKDLGSATRTNDYVFVLAGADYTEYLFPGAKVYPTVSSTQVECTVYSSSFSTDTTVRVVEARITASPSAVRATLIKKASGAECGFFFSNDDIAGVSDAQYATVARLIESKIRCSMAISSFSTSFPALRLRPGSSSSDLVLDVVDLSGVAQMTIDGNGNIVNALPTSDPHVVGQWWANSGVITISAG